MFGEINNQSADCAETNRRNVEFGFADLAAQIASAIRTAARSATRDTGGLIIFSRSLGTGDGASRLNISLTSYSISIPGELVMAEFRDFDIAFRGPPLRNLVRCEIEPFIIGVGWVTVLDTANGIVLRRFIFELQPGSGAPARLGRLR